MELREKIARAMAEGRMVKWENRGEATKNWFLNKADQILALIKEAGYVKLADDQNLPSYELPDKPLAQSEWWSGYATGHIEGKEAMLKAGFRKVEL